MTEIFCINSEFPGREKLNPDVGLVQLEVYSFDTLPFLCSCILNLYAIYLNLFIASIKFGEVARPVECILSSRYICGFVRSVSSILVDSSPDIAPLPLSKSI